MGRRYRVLEGFIWSGGSPVSPGDTLTLEDHEAVPLLHFGRVQLAPEVVEEAVKVEDRDPVVAHRDPPTRRRRG